MLLVGRGPEAEFGRRETAHVARLAQHLALKLERTGGRPYGE